MTHEEYMEEHGDDLMFDGVDDTERVFGECAACGGEFTNYDTGFCGTEDADRDLESCAGAVQQARRKRYYFADRRRDACHRSKAPAVWRTF